MFVHTARKKNISDLHTRSTGWLRLEILTIFIVNITKSCTQCARIQNFLCFERGGITNVASRHKPPKLNLMVRFLESTHDVKIEHFLVKYFSK